jgi:hypothetical protein
MRFVIAVAIVLMIGALGVLAWEIWIIHLGPQ